MRRKDGRMSNKDLRALAAHGVTPSFPDAPPPVDVVVGGMAMLTTAVPPGAYTIAPIAPHAVINTKITVANKFPVTWTIDRGNLVITRHP